MWKLLVTFVLAIALSAGVTSTVSAADPDGRTSRNRGSFALGVGQGEGGCYWWCYDGSASGWASDINTCRALCAMACGGPCDEYSGQQQ